MEDALSSRASKQVKLKVMVFATTTTRTRHPSIKIKAVLSRMMYLPISLRMVQHSTTSVEVITQWNGHQPASRSGTSPVVKFLLIFLLEFRSQLPGELLPFK
jgi:hypothetical protein